MKTFSDPFNFTHGAKRNTLRKMNFNPFEPRNALGRWAKYESDEVPSLLSFVADNTPLHEAVVQDFLDSLARDGSTVLKNIWVVGVNGKHTIPDGLVKPKSIPLPYFLETKTGGDPPFTKNQLAVYPLICLGGHVTSFDSRVAQVGLTPGLPFPPLRVLLAATRGPGQPISYIDYCKSKGLEVP